MGRKRRESTAQEARWIEIVRRVGEQVARVAAVDEGEAYLTCCAYSKCLAMFLGQRAPDAEGFEEGVNAYWEAFMHDAVRAFNDRGGVQIKLEGEGVGVKMEGKRGPGKPRA